MTENFQSKSATTLYIYTNMYTALKKTYYSETRSFWFNNQTILLISRVHPFQQSSTDRTFLEICISVSRIGKNWLFTFWLHLLHFGDLMSKELI